MDDADSVYQSCVQPNDSVLSKNKNSKPDVKKGNASNGGKRKRNFALEKQQAKLTKKARRQLASVQARKTVKKSQEELFKGLQEFQLDQSKLNQLSSSSQISSKEKEAVFAQKMKVFSSKKEKSTPKTNIHYYPTDDEDDSSEDGDDEQIEEDKESIQRIIDVQETAAEEPETKQDSESDDDAPGTSTSDVDEREVKQEEISDDEGILAEPTAEVVHRKHVLVSREETIQKSRAELPIFSEEMKIIEAINENLVCIICGETGSGKTTQIPQFLYEAGYASEGELIGITEPRRVAAISMAERVGYELGRPSEVSYQIRYEGTRSTETKVLFMTDGVLLKEMEKDVMLKKYSAILIDEAHERSVYSDVLIGMLSRIVPLRAKTARPLRLVIMSATLRLNDFTHQKLFPVIRPKAVKVEARQFPVTLHFEKKTPDNYLAVSFKKVCRIHDTLPAGAILVFVTGQSEVRQLMAKLKKRYPVVYEKDKSGQVYVKGTKKWKEKNDQLRRNIKLEDFTEEEDAKVVCDSRDIDERGAGEFFDDYANEEEDALDSDAEEGVGEEMAPANSAPLYCLPLYSLLSTAKQRRIFDQTPDGMRLCVIATNVAETSLTIPGVRYVIDGGFEKRRLYDAATGVSRFAVCRISQASADQRAGRAGRIAAGHAYRLYSSAVYQDFQKFSEPEILTKPSDQLVLLLKAMNIVKVINFPFPSAPNEESLLAAERRLTNLGALSETTINGKTEARITALGKTLSMFPLAPAYAKFVALASQHELMKHAINLVSLLSIREPLVPIASLFGQTPEETKELMKNVIKLRKQWCSSSSKRLGDVKVLMHAAYCAEQCNYNLRECEQLAVRGKALLEAKKLRVQLANVVNTSFQSTEDVVIDVNLAPPNDAQANLLRQMLVACFSDRIARRIDRPAAQEAVPKGAYQTTVIKEFVFIDPCSVMLTDEPEYVIYQEIVQVSEKKLMQTVCAVDVEWISQLAESSCRFGEMDTDAEPQYNESRDEIVKKVKAWFGPLNWPLPDVERSLPHNILVYRYFAHFWLDGKIFKKLSQYVEKLLAPPSTMIRSWAKLQERTENLLNRLVEKEVYSRKALLDVWLKDENFLLEEYLDWLPQSLHSSVTLIWPPLEDSERPAKMGRNKIYTK